MKQRRNVTIAAGLGAALIAMVGNSLASGSDGPSVSSAPTEIAAGSFSVSPPARTLGSGGRPAAARSRAPRRVNPLAGRPGQGRRGTWRRGEVRRDPLGAQSSTAGGRTPVPDFVFDGGKNPAACGGCSPPDTNGDVGPGNYVQVVNATKVAIFDKAGMPLQAPFDLGNLWPNADDCHGNDGDPVAVYDPLADRWLLSQFTATNKLCFAISQTPDPQGTYFLYSFSTPQFPDYFKVGVWPNGYYVSTNENTYTAYAFNRAKMLVGDPTANGVRFPGETNFMLPADVDGTTPPPSGGGLFYTFKDSVFHGGGPDRIELFQLDPDFATPANSTFGLIDTFPVAPFTYTVCGFFNLNCIPQSGTGTKVDAVSEWPMHRFPYRSFPDHQTLLGNFTVGGGAATPGAAIRWFELRNTGSGWTLFQEGTEDQGGGLNRFMGSIAIDQAGNIALGYSASSSGQFPSIRYATRAPGDPPGTMQAEQVMKAGTGSQTGSNRWGDYSAMSIDPADDCGFWYTNEYYSPSSSSNWKTAIGTFKVPGCGGPIPHTLSVAVAGSGAGTVSGPGISCPGDCSEDYPDGTGVSLAATPAGGSTFDGWSGACAGTGGCDLTIDADKMVTATFTAVAPPPPPPPPPPSNAFTLGKLKRDTKHGTATLSVTVPSAGTLVLGGSGIKPQRPASHRGQGRPVAKPVSAAGTVKLKIKATGKKRKQLNKKGKVKVKAKVTFAPTGGTAATQSKQVKLKRKRR